jgi:hypothetical protein
MKKNLPMSHKLRRETVPTPSLNLNLSRDVELITVLGEEKSLKA